jgi:5-methylcytosine-specific restriction endonuclease McrBC regulatory subunit McrC
MKPDILIRRANTALLAADCKYKKVEKEDLASQDICQLLAYCTATNTPRGLFLYPLHDGPGRASRVMRLRRR